MVVSRSLPTEIIQRPEGGEQLLVQNAELQVIAGPERGKRCALRRGLIVVGNAADCDLVLEDPAVSRRQLELEATAEGFVLRDLGSTNGTFVGKLRVREAVLTPGMQIHLGRTRLKLVIQGGREPLDLSRHHRFGRLHGASPLMRHCFALLERAAASESTVLIEGESGTGKELAAEAMHQHSSRSSGPLVVADCGAIPASLIESELFGHEKGAFTGASELHRGALERADGGTLFLDEIGELDLALQPRLLRFLDSREVRRVGGERSQLVDVRVIAATNRRLEEQMRHQAFREDLFFRLAVVRVELPPLRRRREDIPLLARELARQLRPDLDPAEWLDPGTLDVLDSHRWPGNVRELRNVIERLAVIPDLPLQELVGESANGAPSAGAPALDEPGLSRLSYHEAKERVLESFERRYVKALLEQEQGVVARAAERAGVPRQTLFRLIRKHGLREEPPQGDKADEAV
jgi:DNA-binding NtrC family response regulator